jgi:hypothetical protein
MYRDAVRRLSDSIMSLVVSYMGGKYAIASICGGSLSEENMSRGSCDFFDVVMVDEGGCSARNVNKAPNPAGAFPRDLGF